MEVNTVRSGSYVQHLEKQVATLVEQVETIGMTLNEYQIQAAATAIYQEKFYPVASLMVESAELADLFVKPWLRGDSKKIDRDKVLSEAGDVLWNLAAILSDCGLSLEVVAQHNLQKLQDRADRGVIMGDGGER